MKYNSEITEIQKKYIHDIISDCEEYYLIGDLESLTKNQASELINSLLEE